MANLVRSKRFWISILLSIGIISLKVNPILLASIIFIITFIFNKNTIRPLKNYKFWIVILVLILIVPIFTGNQDTTFYGINYSSEQLQKTILMTLRGISVFLLFQVLTIDLKVNNIKPVFSKLGIKNFEIIYNLSNKIFPKIKSILTARYSLFKINWKKQKSIESIIIFLTDIFTDFFTLSDSILSEESEQYSVSPSNFINKYDLSQKPCLYIIVGDAGKGKTPWVEELIQLLQTDGHIVDGVISKKHKISDDNWYHDLIRISTNDKRQLTTMDKVETTTKVGKFKFYDDTIKWGNEQLKSINNSDWIIIDEIGLLEFDGGGFLPGLISSTEYSNQNILFTIRSSMQQYFDQFIIRRLPKLDQRERYYINL